MGGPFALPVPAYHLGHNKSRLNKRKRASDAGNDNGMSDATGSGGGGGNSRPAEFTSTPFGTQASFSSLPADSINPLSHSPDTLRQFAVAGLDPGKRNNAFSSKRGGSNHNNKKKGGRMSALTSGSEADVDTDVSDSNNSGGRDSSQKDLDGEEDDGFQMDYSARMQHLSTLTAIMHRCLHDGDIPRAKRAFNLLIRTKDVDIRVNGLWNIGVEILMREGEQPKQQQPNTTTTTGTGTGDAADDKGKQPEDPWRLGEPLVDSQQDTQAAGEGTSENPQLLQLPERWGSAANIDAVRDYLQSLIQQYPYDKQRPHMVSAVDFWPTLFSTEIYNLDAEFKKAMRQLEVKEDEDGDENEAGESSENESSRYRHSDDEDENGEDDRETRRLRRREDARQARRHRARDEVRAHTRAAAEQVAARMDQQMENRPYGTHGELLRLRGMLSLYVADLHLCASLVAKVEEARRTRKEKGEIPPLGAGSNNSKQRKGPKSLRKYAETEEERTTSRQRDAEIEKARRFFQKKLQSPGAGDDAKEEDWVRKFAEGHEGDEDENSE
ncbi:hypothetical protein PG991_006110 [Apiospora marii]|uniref:Rrn9 domain-containing protein n=1 Tax=Apiospora marii TaxID=335849 RepID=A0ABR1SCX6_9PEZI